MVTNRIDLIWKLKRLPMLGLHASGAMHLSSRRNSVGFSDQHNVTVFVMWEMIRTWISFELRVFDPFHWMDHKWESSGTINRSLMIYKMMGAWNIWKGMGLHVATQTLSLKVVNRFSNYRRLSIYRYYLDRIDSIDRIDIFW